MSKTVRMAMLVVASVAMVSVTHSLVAFNLLGRAWPDGAHPYESGLGPAAGLANGAGSWDDCAAPWFAAWNNVLAPAGVGFIPVPPTVPPGAPDMVNSLFFADDVFGTPFGESALAVEQSWTINPGGGVRTSVESDIAVNNAKKFNCFSGPHTLGPVPEGPAGTIDLGRVVGHELGHGWGMGHPDDIGQTVPSIMNAFISDLDVLQADDISGVLTNYGIAVTSIPFPPRDQVLAFYLDLENEYRDTLGRPRNNPGNVNAEGSAVWLPEFLRYVLNDCTAPEATSRVLLNISTGSVQPVCGVVAPGVFNFPPRNLSLDFLTTLDTYYRDVLMENAPDSYIDLEGKAVWLEVYLGYRVNGCNGEEATDRVFQQIRSGGSVIPPACAT